MNISSLGGNAPLSFSTALTVRQPEALARSDVGSDSRTGTRALAQSILELREAVARLRSKATVRLGGKTSVGGAAAQSRDSLSLNTTPRATTLRSFEEINTQANGFQPVNPRFSGGSTAGVTIGGTPDGTLGSQTLTFRAKFDATVGVDKVEFQVRDQSGSVIDNVRFDKSEGPGTVKNLVGGLTISLGAGDVERHDTFTVDVSDGDGEFRPDNPFNGSGAQGPNFQGGQTVSEGSFRINGTRIDVAAHDTVRTVLDRISASSAGVNATFDEATEEIVLTHKTAGSNGRIELSDDNSGFLRATKLNAAVPTVGVDSDLDRVIGDVSGLSGIATGSFQINGAQIAVDTQRDTLSDVLERIGSSGIGVTAEFDDAAQTVSVTGPKGRELRLEDGTSGLFTGLAIETGRHRAESDAGRSARFENEGDVRSSLGGLGETLQSVFGGAFAPAARGLAQVVSDKLGDSLTQSIERFGEAGDLASLGFSFDLENEDGGIFQIDAGSLRDAVRGDADRVAKFLLEDDDSRQGFLVALEESLAEVSADLRKRLDPELDRGLIIDLEA